MNALATTEQISAETLEHVLGSGDISKLTVPQRVEFYRAACKSLGLNPLTRPIRFLSFQGQMQAYFTRDGTDQLRKNNKITLNVVDKQNDGEIYVVTVRARTPDGREDEDFGAVVLGKLQGDARANALMRCITKAKRRVTLSICGLGWISEDELDTMAGVQTFDADDPPPAVQAMSSRREQINAEVPMPPDDPAKRAAAEERVTAKIQELVLKFEDTDFEKDHKRLFADKKTKEAIEWLQVNRPERYEAELRPAIVASHERTKPKPTEDAETPAADPFEEAMQLASEP